jgi:hypothetical protein
MVAVEKLAATAGWQSTTDNSGSNSAMKTANLTQRIINV